MIVTGKARSQTMGGRRFDRSLLTLAIEILAVLGSLPTSAAEPATVTFTLDFPGSDPEHYSISVESDGRAGYECSAKISDESEDRETYQTEFTISAPTRARIFDLTAQPR